MADNILTRKIGPLPGWAWGGIALVGGLGFFYLRRSGQSQQSQAGNPGSMVNNPAASTIVPYVPPVTITGLPPEASPMAPATNAAAPPPSTSGNATNAIVIGAGNGAQGAGARSGPGFGSPVTMRIPQGSVIQVDPTPLNTDTAGLSWYRVVGGTGMGLFVYSSEVQVTGSGGGQGGWGQAGSANPAQFFGWTAGFTPAGGGNPGTVLGQRAGVPAAGSGGRFDYGGAGGPPKAGPPSSGPHGRKSHGGTPGLPSLMGGMTNRRLANVNRPIRRRMFSGR